eukprot:758247-Hanusia_phi.AAC.4
MAKLPVSLSGLTDGDEIFELGATGKLLSGRTDGEREYELLLTAAKFSFKYRGKLQLFTPSPAPRRAVTVGRGPGGRQVAACRTEAAHGATPS